MHYLYIIYSESIDKYYIGEATDLDIRLAQHNQHYFKKNFTKAAADWKIIFSKICSSREEAIYL